MVSLDGMSVVFFVIVLLLVFCSVLFFGVSVIVMVMVFFLG